MDSTWIVVALMGMFVLSAAVAASAASVFLDVVEVLGQLLTEPRSLVDTLFLGLVGLSLFPLLASLLARFLVFFGRRLPTAVFRVNQYLESAAAGTVLRVNQACQSALSATRGFFNALGEMRLARILAQMLGCFVLALLPSPVRRFWPGITRRQRLRMDWLEEQARAFVDTVCIDKDAQSERRRLKKSRELSCCTQQSTIEQLDNEVGKAAWNAIHAFRKNGTFLYGKFELSPAGPPVQRAAVSPEDVPVPRLGLWFRLRHHIDIAVHVLDHEIRLFDDAIAKNNETIAVLRYELSKWIITSEAIVKLVRIGREQQQAKLEADRRSRIQSCPAQQTAELQVPTGCSIAQIFPSSGSEIARDLPLALLRPLPATMPAKETETTSVSTPSADVDNNNDTSEQEVFVPPATPTTPPPSLPATPSSSTTPVDTLTDAAPANDSPVLIQEQQLLRQVDQQLEASRA